MNHVLKFIHKSAIANMAALIPSSLQCVNADENKLAEDAYRCALSLAYALFPKYMVDECVCKLPHHFPDIMLKYGSKDDIRKFYSYLKKSDIDALLHKDDKESTDDNESFADSAPDWVFASTDEDAVHKDLSEPVNVKQAKEIDALNAKMSKMADDSIEDSKTIQRLRREVAVLKSDLVLKNESIADLQKTISNLQAENEELRASSEIVNERLQTTLQKMQDRGVPTAYAFKSVGTISDVSEVQRQIESLEDHIDTLFELSKKQKGVISELEDANKKFAEAYSSIAKERQNITTYIELFSKSVAELLENVQKNQ